MKVTVHSKHPKNQELFMAPHAEGWQARREDLFFRRIEVKGNYCGQNDDGFKRQEAQVETGDEGVRRDPRPDNYCLAGI